MRDDRQRGLLRAPQGPIREDVQRQGHGTVMLQLAERFACDNGCNVIKSFVNPEAITFYERCGFNRDEPSLSDAPHVAMRKATRKR